VQTRFLDGANPIDSETAFWIAIQVGADGVLVVGSAVSNSRRKKIADLTVIPAISESSEEVEAGGLMSYGTNASDLYRRAATYVDKILKAAKPADLPVEQPKQFELVINLKAAKQISLTIPPSVLARADRVIS
jgi:putative ABC transport system substrate-binding protein